MAGKFTFTLQEYQEAAVKYRADLLMLPIIGIGDTLQYMTGRPGIRYKERVGNLTGDAQFAPYNPQRAVDYNLGIEFRDLETYFGSGKIFARGVDAARNDDGRVDLMQQIGGKQRTVAA